MTALHLKRSNGRSPWRFGFVLIPLMLACFGLLPTVQAVNPPPDGGYGNQNTAEGTDALFSLTTGVWNVAVGFQALHSDTTGNRTPRPVIERFSATSAAIRARPTVLRRFLSIQLAA